MDKELEALFITLGIQPDEISAEKSVKDMLDTVQKKIKSSVYGDKRGIKIPATIEGKYKNGNKIEKGITDAYTAIFKTMQQMADKSASLTLKELSNFEKQVNIFKEKTNNKSGNPTIANARNNLTQLFSPYRELVDDLNKQITVAQRQAKLAENRAKKQTQQANKTNQTSHRTNKPYISTGGITKGEIRHARKIVGNDERYNRTGIISDVKPYISTGGMTKGEVRHAEKVADNTYKNQIGIEDYVEQRRYATEQHLTTKAWENINKRLLRLSNYGGPHGSPWVQSQARETLKFWGPNAESLKTFVDKIRAMQSGTGKFDKSAYKAKENASYAQVALKGGQLMGKTPDVSVADLAKQIADTMTETLVNSGLQDISVALKRGIKGTTSELMNRFKDGGYIGINYGKEGDYKGIGVNYERWQSAMKQIFQGFSSIDTSALKNVFNYTRDNLTQTLKDINIEEQNLTNSIKEIEKKISDNKSIIGHETFSFNRKNITDTLKKSKNTLADTKANLDETMTKLTTAQNRDMVFRLAGKNNLSSEQETQLKSNPYYSEYKNLIKQEEKYKQAQARLSTINESIKRINDKIKESEMILTQNKNDIDSTEKLFGKIKSATSKELQQIQDSQEKLKQENIEIGNTIQELKKERTKLNAQRKYAEKKIDTERNTQKLYTFSNAYDESSRLKKRVEELEAGITQETATIKKYEEMLANVNSETKKEKTARLEHVELLKQENIQLREDAKQLEALKKSLETDKDNAQNELYNEKNYASVRDLLATSLLPLTTHALAGENIANPTSNVSSDTEKNIEQNNQEVRDNTRRTNNILEQDVNSTLKKLAALINGKDNSGKCPCEPILNAINQNIMRIVTIITSTGVKTTSKLKDDNINKNKQALSLVPFIKTNWINPNQFGEDAYGNKVVHGGQEYPTKVTDRAYPDFRPTVNFGISETEEIKKYSQAVFKHVSDNLSDSINNAIKAHTETMQMNSSVDVPRSNVYASLKDPAKWSVKLVNAFEDLLGVTIRYRRNLAATSEEQDKMAAERIKTYGLDRGRNITGDRILLARSMSLWRNTDKFKQMFKDLKLSEGVEIDTTKVTEQLGRVLTGRQWRNAQMGGSPLRQILGYFTGFAGMPSIEKSRASADALNQINANIRTALSNVLTEIQDKESALAGMKESGDLKLGANGEVLEESSVEAKTLAAQLENSKVILTSLLGDMSEVDKTIKKSHSNIGKIMKRLSFASPILRENNAIVQNINAGYDKNGKALRFQSRTAEILNHSFRLMSRHISQMFKNLLWTMSPINIIRRTIRDFMSYDIKWQRTMNVVKYNLRSVIRPFMEWVAQSLVNVIGFIDIISQRIQSAFGKVPVSLFDQVAADAEKTAEEILNVSAGFDELHDIGSDNIGANDLFGEIYKPNLSKEWIDVATQLGDLLGKLFHGDLGFGEAMNRILKLLGTTLKAIAKSIWEWFKRTAIGEYITSHWKEILAGVLKAFLVWKLLKIAGATLFKALFGKFTSSAVSGLFSNVGNWVASGLKWIGNGLWKFLGLTKFGTQIQLGIQQMLHTGGLIGAIKSGGTTLGSVFVQAFTAVFGVFAWDKWISKSLGKISDNNVYNKILMGNGGKEEDKKSNIGQGIWATIKGSIAGAIGGIGLGGLPGAAIGAVIGGLAAAGVSIKTAFTDAKVSIDDMNKSLQTTTYYNATIKGLQTAIAPLQEQLNIMNDTLQIHIDEVYTQGDALGITRERMNELVQAVTDGTFSTDVLTGSEIGLKDSLISLAEEQEKVTEKTKKLEEMQKKLEKAQLDLQVVNDMTAGNFELAAARIEYALASGAYSTEEAATKMSQVMTGAGDTIKNSIYDSISDTELRDKLKGIASVTNEELDEISKIYNSLKETQRDAYLENLDPEIRKMLQRRAKAIEEEVNKHPLLKLLDIGNNGKIFGISYIGDVAKMAVGTNYVPNDGLAYLHQGEAVIPKKYNQPYQPQGMSAEERAYMSQMMNTMRSLDNTMQQGITVNGEFRQRGSDLVAIVDKNKSRTGADLLSNVSYAR